eukprot:13481854-Alexandrium_andersonii.AAC.1
MQEALAARQHFFELLSKECVGESSQPFAQGLASELAEMADKLRKSLPTETALVDPAGVEQIRG